MKQSESCNAKLDRALKRIASMTLQLNEMNTIAEQLKQQLNTKKNELEAKGKEKEKFCCVPNRCGYVD